MRDYYKEKNAKAEVFTKDKDHKEHDGHSDYGRKQSVEQVKHCSDSSTNEENIK